MLARHFVSFKKKKKKNSRGLFVQAASDSQALLRCLREVPLNALVSVPVKGLEFAPAFGPSVDGVVIDPGDPEDQDFTLQVDTINTLNNILLRKDVVAKLSRYSSYLSCSVSSCAFTLNSFRLVTNFAPYLNTLNKKIEIERKKRKYF